MSPTEQPWRALGQSPEQRAELLDKTQWARDLDYQQVKMLAGYLEAAQVRNGTVLFEEGSTETSMLLIVSGQIEVLKADSGNRRKVVSTLGPGKTIGEMALIDGQPRSASARAGADTVVLRMTPKNFQRMQEEVPKLAIRVVLKIARLMSGHLRQTTSRLSDHIPENKDKKA